MRRHVHSGDRSRCAPGARALLCSVGKPGAERVTWPLPSVVGKATLGHTQVTSFHLECLLDRVLGGEVAI